MRKQTGTQYWLNERRTEAVNAQKPGFNHPMKTSGKASDCVVTRADGTTYVIKAGPKRRVKSTMKYAAQADNKGLALLKVCGYIGDSNH